MSSAANSDNESSSTSSSSSDSSTLPPPPPPVVVVRKIPTKISKDSTKLNTYKKAVQAASDMLHYINLLRGSPVDTTTESLQDTPARHVKALWEAMKGYNTHPNVSFFPKPKPPQMEDQSMTRVQSQSQVQVDTIEFSSLCEHHLLPFYGWVHMAYIPNERIIGLSKFKRTVDRFSQRLQVQEQLTQQLLDELNMQLKPLGAAVWIESVHTCMKTRGAKSNSSCTNTSCYSGEFAVDGPLRREFIEGVKMARQRPSF